MCKEVQKWECVYLSVRDNVSAGAVHGPVRARAFSASVRAGKRECMRVHACPGQAVGVWEYGGPEVCVGLQ